MWADLYRHRQPDLRHPTDDLYKDMQEDSWLYDTSNYPKGHLLNNDRNKKVLGKMKDECGGDVIKEVVAVRPKMYSVEVGKKNIRKAKGVKKCDWERDNARALQRSALWKEAVYAQNENLEE